MDHEDTKSESENFLMSIEDFDIVELEDRLELAMRCNGNCHCNEKPN